MSGKSKIFLGILILLFGAFVSIRSYHKNEMVSLIVTVDEKPHPLDSLPIEKIEIDMGDRKLAVNFLSNHDEAPAVFICTGNGEALYEWLGVQKYLLEHGFSSYVFSYTGFGNSTGEPTANSLFEDVEVAYEHYLKLTPNAASHIGLSHSLGGTPLLYITPRVEPSFNKIIVHAPFSTLRKLLIDVDMASPSFKHLWPDLFNNIDNAELITVPTLYVHSKGDGTVPYQHSEELLEHSGKNATILILEKFGHNAIYQNVSDSLYQPIIEFMKK